MACGDSFLCGTVTVGSTQLCDVTRFGGSMTADILYNNADCRKYPQQAGSTNHRAMIDCTTLNLASATQASSAAPLIGTSAGSGGVVVEVLRTTGTTLYAVFTINPAIYTKFAFQGSHGELATLDLGWEAAGTGGTEPTVTYATATS